MLSVINTLVCPEDGSSMFSVFYWSFTSHDHEERGKRKEKKKKEEEERIITNIDSLVSDHLLRSHICIDRTGRGKFMDTSKINLLTSLNDQNMDTNTEASTFLNRRDGPLAQQLANKLFIVTNTNSSM